MLDKRSGSRLANLWDDAKAEGMSGPELLVYRSNTLGSDKRVTNYGGGNTSSKVWQKDPLSGKDVEVLWVKGSGGDSASIKLDGFAMRVPTPNVSVVDLKFVAKRDTTKEEINAAIKAAADGPLKNILAYTEQPNVSIDFNHDPHSSTFHMDQTKVMEGKFVSILTWYDNEWGFSNRMSDTAVALAKLI